MAGRSGRSACRRGYAAGGLVFALAVLVAWSAALYAQVLQAHRVPVQTTQHHPLESFPSAGFIVVSKSCGLGPPWAQHAEPPAPPLWDFTTVYGLEVDGEESSLLFRRPDPDGVLWRQRRSVAQRYDGQSSLTCAFTAGAFLTHKRTQCLRRTSRREVWTSADGWQPCEFERPFESLAGLMVGNWSTDGGVRQTLPAWPAEAFMLIPAIERRLHATLDDVDRVMAEALRGAASYATAVRLQGELSLRFPDGVWLFQATNLDPLADVGPLVVTLHARRCEGECDHDEAVAATVVKSPPMWRQPLCGSGLRHVSSHQGCVPVVFRADPQEAVIVSTLAFRWPGLLAQWLSPVLVFALLFLAAVLVPYCATRGGGGAEEEVEGLVAVSGGGVSGATVGRELRLDDDDDV